jgi:hypothetical protein
MNVLAMPPPTISTSTLAASARNTVSLVETFDPPTIATNGRRGSASALPSASSSAASNGPAQATLARSLAMPCRGRLGAVCGAKGFVAVNVAEPRHLLRERIVVLFLAFVEAAVFEQHDLSGLECVMPGAPPSTQSLISVTGMPSNSMSPLRDRGQRIRGAPLAFGRSAQGATVTITAAPRVDASLRAGNRRPIRESSVMLPSVVLRDVEVGANEYPLASELRGRAIA